MGSDRRRRTQEPVRVGGAKAVVVGRAPASRSATESYATPAQRRPMPEPDITALLQSASAGQPLAMDQLFAAVYDRLRALARRHLQDERPDHTLGPTGLVHEAFLKLVDTRAGTG